MKKLIILLLFILSTHYISAQKTISIETEGNLESPNPLECVNLSEVSNNNNPADILKGAAKCIQSEKYQKASRLFAIAGTYGVYDTYRVKDKTAHQALLVLQQEVLSPFNNNQIDLLGQSLKQELEPNSESLSEICSKIKEIGEPKYHPTYMIQHGIGAFTGNNGNGLIKDFNNKESWLLVLRSYLKCEE